MNINKNNELYELSGQVESIVYRNEDNGYTVIELAGDDEMITAVGTMPLISVGEHVKLYGTYKNHPSYGQQFSATACERSMPENLDGILKYLSSGAIKGIGPATAQRLVKAFGADTLSVLENDPVRVSKLKGISQEKALDICQQLKQVVGIRELVAYLSGFNIDAKSAVAIWKCFGNQAIQYIEDNPYILCNEKLSISFDTADIIARHQNRAQDDRYRVRAALCHVLNHNKLNGHTCLPKEKLLQVTASLLSLELCCVESALKDMLEEGSLISEYISEKEFIFTSAMHQSETYISARLQMLMRFPAMRIEDVDKKIEHIEQRDNIQYATLQKKAIKEALTKGMLILTGGPGTGKTTTLNAIIRLLKENGQKVCLAAPTGRAAQRMSQVTSEEAKTIHRLLEVSFDIEDKPVFKKNEHNMLNCDAIIVDEVSMVDCVLFESLMKALPLSCRLILVGDCDQLPSVGAGNVLSDLIASNTVPVVELKEIFRQSMQSLIVTNAHKIVSGEMPKLNATDNDFFFIQKNSMEECADTIVDLCTRRLKNTYGYSCLSDIQILSPTKKGPLGTFELNRMIQSIVNPKDSSKREINVNYSILREGDKVMQHKNNYNINWVKDNGEFGEGIFNGDIGILEEVNNSASFVKVRFDDKVAMYDQDSLADLELSYACTVHKSQGNEFEAVVMPVHSFAPQLMYRNLLYTAVTRAKKMLILVGDQSALNRMVQNNKRILRFSGLKDFLIND
ncbi:MAG: ATP-dependent RecD-like DNA helicase [Ruminococcaceae bacterium]|nr:ATP-dependent RecD-like DNA helicase [Oscillospiraceae bacterium]